MSEGWEVLNRGWPDFLAFRRGEDGSTIVRFIEVKAGQDRLTEEQQKLIRVFEQIGLKVEVIYI